MMKTLLLVCVFLLPLQTLALPMRNRWETRGTPAPPGHLWWYHHQNQYIMLLILYLHTHYILI